MPVVISEPGSSDYLHLVWDATQSPSVYRYLRASGPQMLQERRGRREPTLNKRELVEEIAGRTKLPAAEVARVVDSFIQVVTRAVVRGEKVVLSGFGTFHRRARARRMARDIRAGQPIRVPATNLPAFRPGRPFLEAVARRRAPRGRAASVGRARSPRR